MTTPVSVAPFAIVWVSVPDGAGPGHGEVAADTWLAVERLPAVSTASTATACVRPHLRPVNVQEVAVVVATRAPAT